MLVGAIFLTLALAVAVTLYIVMPLWDNRTSDELMPRKEILSRQYQRSTLLADRDRLLSSLLELDADYELKKIPVGEYAPLRERLVREAAHTLRQLDEINLSGKHAPSPDKQDDLEELIALRKQQLVEGETDLPDMNNQPGEATAFQAYCTYCGKPLMPGDKYCPACGSKIPA